MSDPSPSDPKRGLPEGIPAPPPPRPDLKDVSETGPTYAVGKETKKRKGRRERNHPTDPYEPLPKKRGCCGCLGGSLVFLVLLAAGVIAAAFFSGPGRFVREGYAVVNLDSTETEILEAPVRATLYVGKGEVRYLVPETPVPVAVIAREVVAGGDFLDAASFTAVKVTASEEARFAKDLEVFAAEFTDLGMTLKGELRGRVIRNLP